MQKARKAKKKQTSIRTFGLLYRKFAKIISRKTRSQLCTSVKNFVNYQNDQIKEHGMGGTYSTQGEIRNAYKIVIGKPKGKGPLGQPRRRWEDNIQVDLKDI